MPSPSEANRDRRLYVEDMLEFCERAMRYADGHSLDALMQDTSAATRSCATSS